jgi:hypothetical protein
MYRSDHLPAHISGRNQYVRCKRHCGCRCLLAVDRAEVPAFFGTHRVSVGGETREVVLAPEDGRAELDMR